MLCVHQLFRGVHDTQIWPVGEVLRRHITHEGQSFSLSGWVLDVACRHSTGCGQAQAEPQSLQVCVETMPFPERDVIILSCLLLPSITIRELLVDHLLQVSQELVVLVHRITHQNFLWIPLSSTSEVVNCAFPWCSVLPTVTTSAASLRYSLTSRHSRHIAAPLKSAQGWRCLAGACHVGTCLN